LGTTQESKRLSKKKNKATPTSQDSKKGKSAGGKSGKGQSAPAVKVISDNRKSRHRYQVLDSIECGMILLGSEVKSLRDGKCQLDEAYGRVKGDTLWLINCNISEYPQATVWNHEPKRPRQLLVHNREMRRFANKAKEKGLTLVPLKLYFNERGIAKCEMGLCQGLKLHDKREKLKRADSERDMQRAIRHRIK
jgi:SsrA-binding protein